MRLRENAWILTFAALLTWSCTPESLPRLFSKIPQKPFTCIGNAGKDISSGMKADLYVADEKVYPKTFAELFRKEYKTEYLLFTNGVPPGDQFDLEINDPMSGKSFKLEYESGNLVADGYGFLGEGYFEAPATGYYQIFGVVDDAAEIKYKDPHSGNWNVFSSLTGVLNPTGMCAADPMASIFLLKGEKLELQIKWAQYIKWAIALDLWVRSFAGVGSIKAAENCGDIWPLGYGPWNMAGNGWSRLPLKTDEINPCNGG